MSVLSKELIAQVKSELLADGWSHLSTVVSSLDGLKYGLHFTKEGNHFYLNQDTYMIGFDGPMMAECCLPLFN
jgi:hypothetical protein